LNGKVDVIITDSPLVISMLYNKTPSKYFNDFVLEQYNTFYNLTFFLNRPENYQVEGRMQTKEESEVLDVVIKDILDKNGVYYHEISCENAVDVIVNLVKEKLNK
jgi:hypothetical protein